MTRFASIVESADSQLLRTLNNINVAERDVCFRFNLDASARVHDKFREAPPVADLVFLEKLLGNINTNTIECAERHDGFSILNLAFKPEIL